MSYDLIIQPPRGTLLPLDETRTILEGFVRETKLEGLCEITDLALEPSSYEAETLEECLDSGEFTRSDFESFCRAHGMKAECEGHPSFEAAALFLHTKWGQNLFSPTLPREDEEVREAYRLIVDFARRHNLVVHDPQVGRDIDLENPGEFPPMWEPAKNPQQRKGGWFFGRTREQ